MKDEFFALTLTGVGAIFGAGILFAATIGSALKGDWATVTVTSIIGLLLLSAARSDARTELRDGIYRGRLFHVRDGADGLRYGPPKGPEHHAETLQ